MEEKIEDLETQKTQEGETPEVVSLTQEEYQELKHKSEVSSQNFERLKKIENENIELQRKLSENNSRSEIDLSGLTDRLSTLEESILKNDIISQYPVLSEAWQEFEEFRKNAENSGMSIKTAAKVFVVEKGLIQEKRKGLERSTGGDKAPSIKPSVEDIEHIRVNSPTKYREMLKNGQIKF